MTAIQHVCAWKAINDERFQVCVDPECEMWRWSPAYSDRAAIMAHRKTLDGPRAHVAAPVRGLSADVARGCIDGNGNRGPQTGETEDVA